MTYKPPPLTEVEQLSILAIFHNSNQSCADEISQTITQRTGYVISFGGLYAALNTLRNQGLLKRTKTRTTSRTKYYFSVTKAGKTALHQSLSGLQKMLRDLNFPDDPITQENTHEETHAT